MIPEMTSIRLVNVGSWVDQTFELSSGVTLIVGDTDAGKSNLRRALEWFLYDDAHWDSLLRNGEKQALVQVTFSDGVCWSRERGPRFNGWGVAGGQFTKEQRYVARDGTPAGLVARFGALLIPVEGNPNPLKLHVHPQDDPKWFLSLSPAQRTRTLAMLCGFDVFERVQRDIARGITAATQEVSQYEAQTAELQLQVQTFTWIDKAEVLLSNVERASTQFEATARLLTLCQEQGNEITRQRIARQDATQLADKLEQQLVEVDQMQARWQRVERVLVAVGVYRHALGVERSAQGNLVRLEQSYSLVQDAHRAVETLLTTLVPREHALTQCLGILAHLRGWQEAQQKAQAEYERLARETEVNLAALDLELQGVLRTIGKCWTCGAVTASASAGL